MGLQKALAHLNGNEYAKQSTEKHYRIMGFFPCRWSIIVRMPAKQRRLVP